MSTATTPKVKREELNACTVQLEICCTSDQVREGFDKAYKQFAKGIRVPGFRPGHAPKSVLQNMINPADLANQAAENIVSRVIRTVLKEENIQPHDSPVVNVTDIDPDKGVCNFTAKVPLAPIVELGDYKGLTAERLAVTVSDEEVEEHISELRKRSGKREAVTDRGAADGDIAVVNIKVEKEDGEGHNFMSVIGKTFDGLDKVLQGMRAEEMKSVELTFPDNFQQKEWQGKKLKVKVTLKSVNAIAMPELDDEFAKSLKDLKSENVKDLKSQVKERIMDAKQTMANEMVNEALLEQLSQISKIQVPDTMWESVANQRLRELDAEARQKGQTLEDVAKANGMTIDEMVASWQNEAKVQVVRAVAAREIFAKEKMQLTNGDFTASLITMAQEYQVEPQTLLEAMKRNNNYRELEIRSVFKKVVDFLNEHAQIKEVESLGGAPKKAAAKKTAQKEEENAPKTPKSSKKKTEKTATE